MNAHTSLSDLNLKVALEYATMGFVVIPCRLTKAPYLKDWTHTKTVDESVIRQWWRQWPDAIPGFPCGINNFLVVDCDRKNGVDGLATWAEQCRTYGLDYTSCPIVETPSGGRHIYFRQGDGPRLRNSAGRIGAGIDTRGSGGQVIAPGALLPDGRAYRLLSGSLTSIPLIRDDLRSFLLSEETPAQAPTPVPNTQPGIQEAERAYGLAILRDEARKVREAEKGTRNSTLNKAAYLVGTVLPNDGISRVEAEELLGSAARVAGLSPDEIVATIKSGLDRGVQKRRPTVAEQNTANSNGISILGTEGGILPNALPRAEQHEWADPKPLPSGLPSVDGFDPAYLPVSIAPWVMDISERMQCPPDFVAISAIIALGSLIGRQVGIRPKPRDSWIVIPNLWGMVIGRPGVMKSPAMSEALAPLKQLEAKAREHHQGELRNYAAALEEFELRKAAAKEVAKKQLKANPEAPFPVELPAEPVEPKPKRLMVSDTTYEALGAVLADNPNGVLAFRDELLAMLKPLDREENAAARGFFLSAWSGTDGYTFDRIIRGHQHIDAVCLSILGSTQPGKIGAYIGRMLRGGDGDDGLIQRFGLLVWPDTPPEWRYIDRFPNEETRIAAFNVFMRMSALHRAGVLFSIDPLGGCPYLVFDAAAASRFIDWLTELEQRLRSNQLTPALESHLGKYRKLVPALALINHLADGGTGMVTLVALERAIALARYLESHARRAYSSGQRIEVMTADAILARIRKGDLTDRFTLRDIHQRDWSNLTDREQVQEGLNLLVDFDWLASERIDTRGRPKFIYHINPKVFS